MQKMAFFTISGLVSGGVGIFIGYLFLKSLNGSANYIFLILSIALVAVSVFCLIKATKPKVVESQLLTQADDFENTARNIANNNNMLNKWNKTNETRDKLKLLKIEAAAKEEADKQT